MSTKQKIFVGANFCVAGLIFLTLYFNLLTPVPPLCNKGHYSFLSYISDIILGHHRNRWMIYVCDYGKKCGEFPKRLDGLMSTYLLSALTGRKFGIIFSKPVSLQELLQPVAEKTSWIVDPSNLVFASCNYYDHMFDEKLTKTLITTEIDLVFPEEVVYLKLDEYCWTSLYQNKRYKEMLLELGYTAFDSFHRSFVNLFDPVPKFKKTIWKYSNQFKSRFSTNLICIISGKGFEAQTKNWQGLWEFLTKRMNSNNNNNNTRLLITKENSDLLNEVKARFPKQLLTIGGSSHLIDGDVTVTSEGERLSENFEKNLLDFYSLIQCNTVLMHCGNDLGRVVAFSRNSNEGLYYIQNGIVRETDLASIATDYEEGKCPVRITHKLIQPDSKHGKGKSSL